MIILSKVIIIIYLMEYIIFLLSLYHFYYFLFKKIINNDYVLLQIYRSILCFYISINSIIVIYSNVNHLLTNPLGYKNERIEHINNFILSFFISDLINLCFHKIKRKSLFFHHIFCILTYYINCKYLNNSSIIFTFFSIAELMSICSGIDELSKHKNINYIQFWTKLYRLLIILLIRFPMWLYVFFIGYTTNITYIKFSCYLSFIIMNILDIYWFKICLKYCLANINKKLISL